MKKNLLTRNLLTRIRARFKDESGQSTTEYILILAIVVMIASKMKTKLSSTMDSTINTVDGIIQKTTQDIGND